MSDLLCKGWNISRLGMIWVGLNAWVLFRRTDGVRPGPLLHKVLSPRNVALWVGTTKNRNVNSGPLGCLFTFRSRRSLTSLLHTALLALLGHSPLTICSLAHSLTTKLVGKWIIRCPIIRLFWAIVHSFIKYYPLKMLGRAKAEACTATTLLGKPRFKILSSEHPVAFFIAGWCNKRRKRKKRRTKLDFVCLET